MPKLTVAEIRTPQIMDYIKNDLTKSTGVYLCPDNIHNFRIRIRVKDQSLSDKRKSKHKLVLDKEFGWQEKYFSKEQKDYYSDERNCFTDREREYNRMICDETDEDDNRLLYTYCHEDNFCPENYEITDNINYLEHALNNLQIDSSHSDLKDYDMHKSIQSSLQNPVVTIYNWEAMYIMGDFGDYFKDTWVKNEKLLCSIKYNKPSKTLQIFPDFTNTQPYTLKIQGDRERVFSYFIENCSDSIPESIEANEKTLIKKINILKAEAHELPQDTSFTLPPKNKLYIFLFMEICSGKRFEYPEVYVEYSFHLPDSWSAAQEEILEGRTHFCRADQRHNGLVHFGHCMEVNFEYSVMDLEKSEYTKSPSVYFEVISKDSWDRYRTEGLCYVNLPTSQSGTFNYNLKCFRFTGASPVNEMKRFFIGDCRNYTHVDWIGIPDNHQDSTLNKYGTQTVGTGELNVKLHVVHQSQEFMEAATADERANQMRKSIFDRLGSSTLVKSVEEVILEFKKARKEMLEARKNV